MKDMKTRILKTTDSFLKEMKKIEKDEHVKIPVELVIRFGEIRAEE